jgi:hypothetical protein
MNRMSLGALKSCKAGMEEHTVIPLFTRLRQEDHEFKENIARPHLRNK